MIADIEELILQCQSQTARDHIREAVKCYQSNAYRAAIIGTYIAVSFDLIEKLKALASGGDAEATLRIEELNKLHEQQNQGNPQAVAGLLTFERGLLELFRDKFSFFGSHEFTDLERLREDRNRCAHPTFLLSESPYSPTAELARLHIANALILILTQPPRHGKAALESLRSVILSSYFPSSVADAKKRLQQSELANARPALITAFVDDVAFGFPNSAHPYYQKRSAIVALEALANLHGPLTIERAINNANKLLLSSDAETIRCGAILTLRLKDVGEGISEASKVVMRNWLKSDIDLKGNAVSRGLNISWLKGDASDIAQTLTVDDLSSITFEPAPPEIVDCVVGLFCSAANWSSANTIATKVAVPFADRMTQAQIERVVESAATGKSDLQGSIGFSNFLKAAAKENPLGIEGVNGLLTKYDLTQYLLSPDQIKSE